MQPINEGRLQNQVIPVQQGVSRQKEISKERVKTDQRGNTFTLPDDVVNLSTERSSFSDSSVGKKPSVPVSSVERKALLESFSVYV